MMKTNYLATILALGLIAGAALAGETPAVGISVDDVESHKQFSEKYKLPFVILADETGATAEAYGVLRDWKLTKIAARQSFLVNPEGVIVKHYGDVDPDNHTQEVLADLEAFMQGP